MKTRLIKRLNKKFKKFHKVVRLKGGYDICERDGDGHGGYLDWISRYHFVDKKTAFDCLERIRYDFIMDIVNDMRIQSSRID